MEMQELLGFSSLVLTGRLSGLCRHTASGWRKRGGEKEKFTGEVFSPLPLPCNYSHTTRSLCKLTCGLRTAN